MSRSDFIGDFLTCIRNAAQAKKDKLTVPASSMTVRIAEIEETVARPRDVERWGDSVVHLVLEGV